MILTKEQINRYMRHIIMPEISGQGQKKLIESSAYICGETIEDLSPLIYYLAAIGIGNLFCYFEDNSEYETLFNNIRDLNNDISIKIINSELIPDNTEFTFKIFLGNVSFISRIADVFINVKDDNKFIPTIISLKNQWKGTLQTFNYSDDLKLFIKELSDKFHCYKLDFSENYIPKNSYVTYVLCTLCSIEGVKLCLNIGEIHKNLMYLDIFSMEFNDIEQNKIDLYIEKLLSNNNEEIISYDDNEKKLNDSKIIIVGTGGLGSSAALALSRSGVGTIGLIDNDTVEVSNLNRQILHSTSRIGISKVESAKLFLNNINSNTKIITYVTELNKDNAVKILSDYDIVISGVDNIQTRYLINDACFFLKKPVVEAGVLRFDGINTTIIPGEGHCYRCIYPNETGGGLSCSETGVLGSVPGVMGFIQATEAIKLVIGKGVTLKNKLLIFDALDLEFNVINIEKNLDCPLCGENPSINDIQEYEFNCETRITK